MGPTFGDSTMHVARLPLLLLLRQALAATAALGVLGLLLGEVYAQDPVTDLDRRATLALWNAAAANPTAHRLQEVSADNVRRLDLYRPRNETGAREYALRFGAAAPDGSGRGFYKVLVGGTPVDPAAKGWKLHLTLKDPAAEVWTKRVDNSDSERYVEWAVRSVIGNVLLTVVERRPMADAPAMAVSAVSRRHNGLIAAARSAGLFARARATLYLGVGDSSAVVLGEGAPPLISATQDAREMRLALEMLDAEDRPVEARWFKVVLSGPLARFATLQGGVPRATAGEYVVPDPGLLATLVLQLQPQSVDMEQALLEHFELGSGEPALRIAVSARQR